jgi:hypothetical protein
MQLDHWLTIYSLTLITPVAFSFLVWTFIILLASSQYPEGPALTGQLGTGFSWFPCV